MDGQLSAARIPPLRRVANIGWQFANPIIVANLRIEIFLEETMRRSWDVPSSNASLAWHKLAGNVLKLVMEIIQWRAATPRDALYNINMLVCFPKQTLTLTVVR